MFVSPGTVLIPNFPLDAGVFLAMVGMLTNALPITPGGLGVGEAAFEPFVLKHSMLYLVKQDLS